MSAPRSAFDKCRMVTSSDLTDNKAPRFTAYRIPTPEVIEDPKRDLKQSNREDVSNAPERRDI